MDIKETLKRFGLNDKEVAIYLALLEIGVASAIEISKKTGIYRTYFYDLVKSLVQKGMVRQFKKNDKTLFSANAPEKLLMIEEEKTEELKKIIPQLNAINNLKVQKPKVYYYEGKKGIEEINNDTLRVKGRELIGFTTPRFVNIEDKKISEEYISKRKLIGKKTRVIGEMSTEIMQLKNSDKDELRETRMLPKDDFHSEIEIIVGGNKVYIVNYKDSFGMIIEDKEVADVQRQIFELVWNSRKIIEP